MRLVTLTSGNYGYVIDDKGYIRSLWVSDMQYAESRDELFRRFKFLIAEEHIAGRIRSGLEATTAIIVARDLSTYG